MALSRVVSEIFNVQKYGDIDIPVSVSQLYSIDWLCISCLLVFYSNFVPMSTVFEIFDL